MTVVVAIVTVVVSGGAGGTSIGLTGLNGTYISSAVASVGQTAAAAGQTTILSTGKVGAVVGVRPASLPPCVTTANTTSVISTSTGIVSAAVAAAPTTTTVVATAAHLNNKKRDTSGAKAIHNCDSCGKSFTTKFNLKRHINMHCHKSKENGVPIQGPPSASAPAKKTEKPVVKADQQPQHQVATMVVATTATTGTTGELQQQRPQIANEKQQQQPVVGSLQQVALNRPPQTVLTQSHTIIHNGHTTATAPVAATLPTPTLATNSAVPYSRVVTVPQTEYQRTEPDSTYKLPSVETILPVSTVYTTTANVGAPPAAVTSFNSTIASCDSSQTVSSVSSSGHHAADLGALPADLFDPDSSRSEPPGSAPASPPASNGCHEAEGGPVDLHPVTLTAIPAGWTRKVCHQPPGSASKVAYFSPLGKVFYSYDDVAQYFKTFNFTVPVGLFNFNSQLPAAVEDDSEDEDDDEDSDDDEEDEDEEDSDVEAPVERGPDDSDEDGSICAKRRRNDVQYTKSIGTMDVQYTKSIGSMDVQYTKSIGSMDVQYTKSIGSMSPLQLVTSPSPGGTPSSNSCSPLASACSMCEKDCWCEVCGGGALYHPVPPSTLRTAQSQTYLAYISGLGLASETMCDWRRELAPSCSLLGGGEEGGAAPGSSAQIRIPPWLEKLYSSQNVHGVDSLCALRDFMLQEALNVVKFA